SLNPVPAKIHDITLTDRLYAVARHTSGTFDGIHDVQLVRVYAQLRARRVGIEDDVIRSEYNQVRAKADNRHSAVHALRPDIAQINRPTAVALAPPSLVEQGAVLDGLPIVVNHPQAAECSAASNPLGSSTRNCDQVREISGPVVHN